MEMIIFLESEKYNHPPVLMGKIIAKATNASLDVVVIVPKHGYLENGEAVAEEVHKNLQDFHPQINIQQGDPKAIYQDSLAQKEYELVILQADRKGAVRKYAEIDPFLTGQSDASLLLTENTIPKLERILIASSCKEDDYSLVEQGASFAEALNASVTLLHVISGSVPTMYTGLGQLEETVEEMLQTQTPFAIHLRHAVEILDGMGINSEVKLRRGVPAEEILREAQLENYDLVIVGTTKVKEGIKARVLGNLTSKIVDMVEIPVLLIGTRMLE